MLDDYFAAVNAMDAGALEMVFNHPNVHISSVRRRILDNATDEVAYFAAARVAGWHHSEWNPRTVIHASPGKVHVAGCFKRFRADASLISTHDVLIIVTCENGHWGIKMRSNFL